MPRLLVPQRTLAAAIVSGLIAVSVAGCATSPAEPASPGSPAPSRSAASATEPVDRPTPLPTVTITPTAVTTPSTAASTPPAATPASALLRRGDRGRPVEAVQRRLVELGYWVGPVDGVFGHLMQQGVYAVQKAAGIGPDGVVGPRTRAALDRGARPAARSSQGRVVEVNLDRQLLLLVEDGRVRQVVNTSTGTFRYYYSQGRRLLADTPRGRWRVYWTVDAWHDGPLGRLYRPAYFNRQGIAVHGYTSIPPYPASHGCVRVSVAAMDWLWRQGWVPVGARVWVY